MEEGRVIYDNLRRSVSFAVAGNLLVMLGWPVPLLIAGGWSTTRSPCRRCSLLWLNLMTDGLLGLSMIGWRSNRLLVAVAGLVVGLHLAALYPPLRSSSASSPLGAADLALCVALAAGLLVVLELATARRRSVHRREGMSAGAGGS